ncbi:PREDICTED: tyrosine-protein phosphatase non-receptor type substrate 1-like [Chrysochloris asiatica]|uniref:Tyrosine-protein phosphatase non-receptor type substrate 1-like n=1 Tax=Chrysochloris asiatica TaxID=185453 RepID=A0A9B0WIX7_CHRAS|nr:PREDICTED: tyrosine-protein phosphatase non-receptor type substrate 1-like [Chrysochloris asiatica]
MAPLKWALQYQEAFNELKECKLRLPSMLIRAWLLMTRMLLTVCSRTTTSNDLKLPFVPTLPQTKKLLTVRIGSLFTPTCLASDLHPIGPVHWYKEQDGVEKIFYTFKDMNRNDVVPVSDTSKANNKDFSIRILQANWSNNGTYYCMKFRKGGPADVELTRGQGTIVKIVDV